LRIKRRVCR